MKKYLLIISLCIINLAYSQFNTPKEFFEFSQYTSPKKQRLLEINNWNDLGKDLYEIKKNDVTFKIYVETTNKLGVNSEYKDYTILRMSDGKLLDEYLSFFISVGFELSKTEEFVSWYNNEKKKEISLQIQKNVRDEIFVIQISYEIENFYDYLKRASKELEDVKDKSVSQRKSYLPSEIVSKKESNTKMYSNEFVDTNNNQNLQN
nr:hypothetical protein [uncultured Psychroserpens sp.]